MGFFALVLALLIERLRPLRPGNRLRTTIGRLAHSVRVRLDRGRRRDGVIGWVLVMVISLLAVLVAESLAAGLHPVFVFALHVFVLYCTIGFRQFSEAFTEIRVAFAADDAAGAGRILAAWVRDSDAGEAPVSLDPDGDSAETCRKAAAHALLIAHRQVLGPLFCYIVIPGAAGPLLYRVAETLARHWRREEGGDPQT
ncbi:MAG TPA: cobalamin biosynthesis protein, partial [Burkholderiaceae bacterium]|nr:cobalamin biosynthesis protein [Burkholderiaceae bacterium]